MPSRYFALIPAAGHSSRMGRPKLLMPLDGRPIITHTIGAWRRSQVDRIIVVVRPGDESLLTAVREAGNGGPTAVDVVVPKIPPPDMKESLQAAVAHIEKCHDPRPEDAFLVAPADMPRLSPAIIDRLIEQHRSGGKTDILVPTISGQRGHPVLFPWLHAAQLFALRENEGLNTIVERSAPSAVSCDDLIGSRENPFADVDTLQEYERMTKNDNV